MPQVNMVFITGCVRLFHRKRPALTPFAQFLTHLLLQRIRCYPSALLKCSGRRLGTQTLPAVWSALWGANEAPQYDRLTKRSSFVSGKMGLCVTPTLKWTRTGNQTKIVVHACYKVFFGLVLKKKKNHQLRSVGSVWGAGSDSTPTELNYKIAEQLRFTDVIQQPDNTAFQSARAPGLMNY